MPKLSPTMESGVIAQWLVKVGDTVKEGDILADIETDKATMQMKSYDDGVIVHIDHPAGEEVALGQRVMILAKKGEDPKQVASGMGLGGGQGAAAAKAPETEVKPALAAAGSSGATTSGNGQQETAPPPADVHEGRLKTSPLARKMAESSQIDLSRIRGTGPGGRIIRRDIEAYLSGSPVSAPATATPTSAPAASASTPTAPSPAPVQAPAARPAPAPGPAASPARPLAAPPALAAQRIPHTRMRKTIAQRMLQAKQTAPEIHVSVDARVDKLVAVREELNRHLACREYQALAGRLRDQGRGHRPAQASGAERQLRARRDRSPR